MKIAFFHNLSEGGAKRVVFEQVKYLSKKHEINVFEISQKDNKFNDLKTVSRVKEFKFSLDNNLPWFLNRLYSDYKNFYQLGKLHKQIANEINSNQFDLAIVHPDRYTQSPFLLRYLKIPSIYFCEEVLRITHERDLEFTKKVIFIKKWYEKLTRKIRKKMDKKNALAASLILANSNFTRENIKKAYQRDSQVFLLGVDPTLFKPLNKKKTVDVLFIGEKEYMEGYDLFEEMIKNKSIKTKVLNRKNKKFTFSDKDLVNEYNKAKIVVALNKNEPFGLIPLEAMSCGIPVIAVNEGGFRETVRNNFTGYLIKRDKRELIASVRKLLNNNKLYEEMASNCREYVIHNWDWNVRMPEFEKYLKIK